MPRALSGFFHALPHSALISEILWVAWHWYDSGRGVAANAAQSGSGSNPLRQAC